MLTCRSIPPELWEQARERLIYFFSRRHAADNAEDLAQETLAVVLSRDDYVFEKREDFLKVCIGFARFVLKQHYRRSSKETEPFDEGTPARVARVRGLSGPEIGLFVEDVQRIASSEFPEQRALLDPDEPDGLTGATASGSKENANRLRVQLHRLRKKLGRLTGWTDEV